jgi:hypothetical protein
MRTIALSENFFAISASPEDAEHVDKYDGDQVALQTGDRS